MIPFYRQSFVMEVHKAFVSEEEKPSDGAQNVTLIKKRGRVVGLSPGRDQKQPSEDELDTSFSNTLYSEGELGHSELEEAPVNGQCGRPSTLHRFKRDHPLYDSHGTQFITNNGQHVPNFLGATLPRCDQGDRKFYCSTTLALFKPWKNGKDLKKSPSISWDDEFNAHSFKRKNSPR